jgi:hypothetical protein
MSLASGANRTRLALDRRGVAAALELAFCSVNVPAAGD